MENSVLDIIKVILDYGLTGGALIVLAYVILQQMKMMQTFQKAIIENTAATNKNTDVIMRMRERESEMINAVQYCKQANR